MACNHRARIHIHRPIGMRHVFGILTEAHRCYALLPEESVVKVIPLACLRRPQLRRRQAHIGVGAATRLRAREAQSLSPPCKAATGAEWPWPRKGPQGPIDELGVVRAEDGVRAFDAHQRRHDIPRVTLPGIVIQQPCLRRVQLLGEVFQPGPAAAPNALHRGAASRGW